MKKLTLISAVAIALLVGCGSSNENVKKPLPQAKEVKGIRTAPLNADSQNLPKIEYHAPAPMPGQVKPFKKSFVTAPPMIPHSIDGMVPITAKKNACLSCHLPQNAKAMGITPMPEDHFVDNFQGGKKVKKVAGSRWFCTTCHTPQAKLDPVIQNNFEKMKSKAGLK